jgi:predicted Holliday junction resolvase-like endonuclease
VEVVLVVLAVATFAFVLLYVLEKKETGRLRSVVADVNEYLRKKGQQTTEPLPNAPQPPARTSPPPIPSALPSLTQQQLERIKQEQLEIARKELRAESLEFRQSEMEIRQDAIKRSKAVILGKVTEHLVPYLPLFQYNPKDARFIGSPVDMIIFDGLSEENLKRIVIVEVKTGSATLTKREKMIRDAIKENRVEWSEIRVDIPTKEE